ncbi:alpha/beta hydrolase [Amnibacterium sp.]|uniref:alpha/beta fold hydrolase n=1 Tax=Amnibacterium sp. TaxID=1872496 RepID=UPI002628A52B|nr:alpha/beta hydrolase [Amnibacterium sp.]MCU1474135.1 hydrolase [Amnibacterium sp.]
MDSHLDRPDVTLAYSSAGPKDADHTMVVAHSLATSRAWEDEVGIMDWSAVAAAGNRLIRFDTRGHGASTGTDDGTTYRWPRLAEDYLAVADSASPDRPIDGLGSSTGCGVLLWAAVAAPRRFRRLVLVVPPTRGEARAAQAQLYLAAAQMIELRGRESWQRVMRVTPPAPILQAGGWTRASGIAVRDHLLSAVLRGAATSIFPDDDQLRAITHPTLILTWDTDPSHPVDTAEYLAERLPNSTLDVATSPDRISGWGRRAAAFIAED